MTFEIKDLFGSNIKVEPRLELYCVTDFFGNDGYGIAIELDEVNEKNECGEPYATLTVSFGEMIGLKNCAYVDTNNCHFAEQLLKQGIAKDTGLKHRSGYCTYPLWQFDEKFLRSIGEENYKEYADVYEELVGQFISPPCQEPEKHKKDKGDAR